MSDHEQWRRFYSGLLAAIDGDAETLARIHLAAQAAGEVSVIPAVALGVGQMLTDEARDVLRAHALDGLRDLTGVRPPGDDGPGEPPRLRIVK